MLEVLPLPRQQVSFREGERELCRWHFDPVAPNPYLFPLTGPGGRSVTRMGHPGAANHDHHRSVWFAHHDVSGVNFWEDPRDRSPEPTPFVRQRHWLVYDSGPVGRMAVLLDWLDGHDPTPLLSQTLIVSVRPLENGEWTLDLDSQFKPTAERLELGQTNFGMLGIRVAESIAMYFGSGTITGADGRVGEKALFGEPNRWVDYSGPNGIPGDPINSPIEGITCFDHPMNPGHPVRWHVREDGWMGPGVTRTGPLTVLRRQPLRLRYRLHIHRGAVDADRANVMFEEFAREPAREVVPDSRPHRKYKIVEVT